MSELLVFIVIALPIVAFCCAFFVTRYIRRLRKPLDELNRKVKAQKDEILLKNAEIERKTNDILVITESMREGLLLLDGRGSVLLANNSASRLLGVSETEGKHIEELCRDHLFLEGVRGCLGGCETAAELKRGGDVFEVRFSPTVQGGAAAVFINVTDKYAAEAHRRQFSANVSHELKTPLTAISASAEMIENGMAKDGDVRAFAAKILKHSARLQLIIEDVIKLAEFDEGRAEKDFTRFDALESAKAAAESLSEKAKRRGVTLDVGGESVFVSANAGMIDELLSNLADNAVKYNKPNGSASIWVEKRDNYCVFTVKDTGIGIAPKHLPRVFERFYRADKSRSKETGGTGLGLSIAKHIAEFHGGVITVESEVGTGTTVVCTILV